MECDINDMNNAQNVAEYAADIFEHRKLENKKNIISHE